MCAVSEKGGEGKRSGHCMVFFFFLLLVISFKSKLILPHFRTCMYIHTYNTTPSPQPQVRVPTPQPTGIKRKKKKKKGFQFPFPVPTHTGLPITNNNTLNQPAAGWGNVRGSLRGPTGTAYVCLLFIPLTTVPPITK